MNYEILAYFFHDKMKDFIFFALVLFSFTIINNFVNGFLFDNLKKFSDIIQTKGIDFSFL